LGQSEVTKNLLRPINKSEIHPIFETDPLGLLLGKEKKKFDDVDKNNNLPSRTESTVYPAMTRAQFIIILT
jgi:hypothetical protein